MGRKDAIFTIAWLAVISVMFAGCGGSSGVGGGGGGLDYGPPFGEIFFNDGSGNLATVASVESNADPLYFPGIGLNGAVSDLGFGFILSQNSNDTNADVVAYDIESSMLYVIDEDGEETSSYFDGEEAVENLYALSSGGSRLVYVRELGSDHELILAGVTTSTVVQLAALGTGERYYGRPAIYISGSKNRIVMMIENTDTQDTKLVCYSNEGDVLGTLSIPVQAVSMDPDGDYIAFIDAEEQNEIIFYDDDLENEQWRADFSEFGTGVSALSWSPDGEKIAFFTGAAGTTGKLVVYDLGDDAFQQVFHDDTYIFPIGSDKLWAAPAWNPNGNELAFTVRTGDGMYNVVKTDLAGVTTTLYEDVGDTRYVVWMSE
ncbi:hypothetical protein KQI52_03145 [bacterium]|nr:hypothetical protein [bacterium]